MATYSGGVVTVGMLPAEVEERRVGHNLGMTIKCLSALIALSGVQYASAATWCVSQIGQCAFQSIGAAVAGVAAGDLIQVQAGIYSESVVITKPLSLVGSGSGTIINAIGLSNGIFINGMATAPAAGISHVIVTGLTVTNANFEGILVANATQVTISNNLVTGNNRSLISATGTCPGIASFETNEQEDCGEGIHLMAVDHSVVADNTVKNNSGGILITDETGPTHDNLISGNNVNNNGYACGITMASHPQSPTTSLTAPAGIYRNTIYGNVSTSNGLLNPGAGAGIGIFAAGPGNQTYSNVIVGNTLTGNGLPGVTMHNHAAPPMAPAANLNDNMIVGNVISGNAQDTEDAATPGPTGINLYSVTPVTGTIIAQNKISNEQIAVAVNLPSGNVETHLNDLQGPTGVDNLGSGTVNTNLDYWGCPAGPGNGGCGGVLGMVVATVWAIIPF